MARFSIVLALLTGATLLPGCFNTVEPGTGPATAELLEGSLGPAQDFSADPTLYTAYRTPYDSYVEVRGQGSGWAVMTGFNFLGTLGEGDLAPGARITITNDWETMPEPAASMIACSGDDPGEWYWDCPPDVATVAIEEGPEPNTLALSFEASFGEACGGEGGIIEDVPPTDPGEPIEPIDFPEPVVYDGPQEVRGRIIIDLGEVGSEPDYDDLPPMVGIVEPPPPDGEPLPEP